MSKPSNSNLAAWNVVEPFVFGGLSGMFATLVIQPMDMVKVRIQLVDNKIIPQANAPGAPGATNTGGNKPKVSTSPLSIARTIVRDEGFGGLYKGLSAALLRQATYTTARLGIFRSISNKLESRGKTTFWEKAFAGLAAGGLGSIVGTPADLALIRMQADGTLPKEQRRNYTGVGNALSRIVREEGFMGMFKGCAPVVVRAMALNVGMLAFHDQSLETYKQYTDNKQLANIGAKATAGFFASAFSLPFDFVKTRIQKQKPDPVTKEFPYRGSIHCATRCLAEEGPLVFYRGFWTYYFRIAPHVMITLFAVDALNLAKKNFMAKK
jgi:solute carrier family 25 oxoglutarate transporter 11